MYKVQSDTYIGGVLRKRDVSFKTWMDKGTAEMCAQKAECKNRNVEIKCKVVDLLNH